MQLKATQSGYLPLSSLRVWCVLREGTRDLLPHPIAEGDNIIDRTAIEEGGLTRPIRFAPGFSLTYSVRIPFGIHSDINCKGFFVTPTKGTTLGCLSFFHMIASL